MVALQLGYAAVSIPVPLISQMDIKAAASSGFGCELGLGVPFQDTITVTVSTFKFTWVLQTSALKCIAGLTNSAGTGPTTTGQIRVTGLTSNEATTKPEVVYGLDGNTSKSFIYKMETGGLTNCALAAACTTDPDPAACTATCDF